VTRLGVIAYGSKPRRHSEAHGAILSAMAHAPADVHFIVLTDSPQRYRWLGDSVTIEHLQSTTLRQWRGPTQDRYRPKIEALRWLAHGGPAAHVVLVDTDTLARRDLESMIDRLDRGTFLLHEREYPLSNPPRRGDRILKTEILGRSWLGITPGPETAMWNGGVVGCPKSKLPVLDEVADVFDHMRPASRHFAIEQLAYSVVFEARGTIEEAAPWIDHYWANRPYFSRAVEHELATMLMSGMKPAEAAARWRDYPVTGPLDGRATGWKRVAERLAGFLGASGPLDD
jgi:hypothetical protein